MYLKKLFNHRNIIQDKYVYLFLFFIGFITYSFTFYHFTYNQDGIGRVFRETISFKNSISIGRWSYFIFFNLMNRAINIPIVIGFILIGLNCLTSYYLFQIFNINRKLFKVIIGSLFMTFPGFIYYFYYLGDIGVYATAIFLITISVYILVNGNSFTSVVLSITLAVIALASYPALFAYLTMLLLYYVLYIYISRPDSARANFILLSKLTFYTLISLFLFFISSKFLLFIYDIQINNYKNAADINIISLFKKLPFKLGWIYLLFARYVLNASFIIKVLIGLNFASILYLLFIRSNKLPEYLYSALLLFLIIPYIFSIYLITYEKWPYAGFEFGFLIFLSIPFIFFIKTGINRWLYIIFAIAVFSNIQNINKVAIEHQLNVEASKHIIGNMIHDIQKHPQYNSSTPILFVGDIENNKNFKFSDIIPDSQLYNAMEVPAGFAGHSVPKKIKHQAALLNIDLNILNTNDSIETFIPEHQYPKTGSIVMVKDTIFINIGATPKIKPTDKIFIEKKENIEDIEEGSLKSNPIAKYFLERI